MARTPRQPVPGTAAHRGDRLTGDRLDGRSGASTSTTADASCPGSSRDCSDVPRTAPVPVPARVANRGLRTAVTDLPEDPA